MLKDKISSQSLNSVTTNLVESASASKDRFKNKGKQISKDKAQKNKGLQPKSTGGKIEKTKLVCYVCGKPGHKSYQCIQRKDMNNQKLAPQVSLAELDDIIVVVVMEANLVENKFDWILDTGASRHFCSNRDLFHNFQDSTDGEIHGELYHSWSTWEREGSFETHLWKNFIIEQCFVCFFLA